ncbi:MAG: hypothetical protein HYZ34_13725 [Ignavibacteriae bacterium]|nr:hypothetical protein [Ignavibacteriota bacterium]
MNQVQIPSQQTSRENVRLVKLIHSRSLLHHLIYSMEHDVSYRCEQSKIAELKDELHDLDGLIQQSTRFPAIH